MKSDYATKFAALSGRTHYDALDARDRRAVRELAFAHRLTFQQLRQVAEAARDLSIWGGPGIAEWMDGQEFPTRRELLTELERHMTDLRGGPASYRDADFRPARRERRPATVRATKENVFGMCPVASAKTVCCNLRTIDAVENCSFGCSYCAVQTFYTDGIAFDENLAGRLDAIDLDPERPYHIGTGQSSDALAWGNKLGMLDALFAFARDHPNILLELKTKSDNVRYIVENDVPANVVCSWSLNTPTIVRNEEHFTARLDDRLAAARRVADAGTRVAFHFHPMVHYRGWREDYTAIARRLLDSFETREVAFLSMGSVTLIKPVIGKIRDLGNPTKILQTELVPDPHGKLTYPDDIKVKMFRAMNEALSPWRAGVFMYLCMEKTEIWERALGRTYPDNDTFERDFARHTAPST